jgi:CRISPR system Cascade subunit CasD
MAFGDVAVDAIGPVRATPSASTLTGLLSNALGVQRWETDRLARLQARLVFGCRLDRRGQRFTEFQTAQLAKDDEWWTTRGRVEGRAGGDAAYDSPHLRYRDHDADACVTVAMRLLDADESPTLDDVKKALDEPARPLFLGRKACLPAGRLVLGVVESPSIHAALLAAPLPGLGDPAARQRIDDSMLVVLPSDEPCPDGFRAIRASERRDWVAGVHTGEILTFHGQLAREHVTPAAVEPRA